MKKNTPTIISAAACVLVVVCLFQISDLKQQISSLQHDVSTQTSNINNNVNSIYSNIDSKLEQQASILAAEAWEYGDADYDAKTVELLCTVTPKEYTEETEAVLLIDDTEYAMTRKGADFTTAVDIPLCGETDSLKIVFQDRNRRRTEALDWLLTPRYNYLPIVYAQFDGGGTGEVKNGAYSYNTNGTINIQVDGKVDYGFASATLVELLDRQEVGRTDIPLDNADFFANYQNENGARPENVNASGTAWADGSYSNPVGPFYYALDKDYTIPFGSTLTLYVELEDENGLLHRCTIVRQEISDGGEPLDDDSWMWMGIEASIYDADGNPLSVPDLSLYQ